MMRSQSRQEPSEIENVDVTRGARVEAEGKLITCHFPWVDFTVEWRSRLLGRLRVKGSSGRGISRQLLQRKGKFVEVL
jgi:hypothetical protein